VKQLKKMADEKAEIRLWVRRTDYENSLTDHKTRNFDGSFAVVVGLFGQKVTSVDCGEQGNLIELPLVCPMVNGRERERERESEWGSEEEKADLAQL
jgi:hypothetical protein